MTFKAQAQLHDDMTLSTTSAQTKATPSQLDRLAAVLEEAMMKASRTRRKY